MLTIKKKSINHYLAKRFTSLIRGSLSTSATSATMWPWNDPFNPRIPSNVRNVSESASSAMTPFNE